MKKYLLFVLSFILLFVVFNVFSGMLQTVFYQPNLSNLWNKVNQLPSEVVFVESSLIPTIMIALLSATMAFFMQSRLSKKSVKTN
ncbi:hypothetical protein [Bacillus sp. AFS017336]|uniref:hypothetical protein n=1 Tax=Bacillus sp. AFS017336 TaxID=2033489 RepID=UPI000BF21B88|nr:hypothetical protein [Bacillus sp. AFS017336]PEL03298.1 hypothetical protein CN601_21995 [Bacillus sp. AFS017336]